MIEPNSYYWKLTAERAFTGSSIVRFVEVPASIGKLPGLTAAVMDLQNELGPLWKVYPQADSRQCFLTRVKMREVEDARLESFCNGRSLV